VLFIGLRIAVAAHRITDGRISGERVMANKLKGKRVAILVAHGFEQVE
jgi:hypothetical protein